MYNIGMHTHLPVVDIPWKWLAKWSSLLEKDLETKRLQDRTAASQAKWNASRKAFQNASRRGMR